MAQKGEICSVCGKKGVYARRSGKGDIITVYNCRYCHQFAAVTAARIMAQVKGAMA